MKDSEGFILFNKITMSAISLGALLMAGQAFAHGDHAHSHDHAHAHSHEHSHGAPMTEMEKKPPMACLMTAMSKTGR